MLKFKIACLALLLLSVYSCQEKVPNIKPKTEDPGTTDGLALSVMTYNILQSSFNNTAGDPHNWSEGRKNRVIKIMQDYAPDLLMCQEDDPQQGSDICLALNRVMAGVSKNGTPGGNSEHNALYYDPDQFVLMQQGHFFYSTTPDAPSQSWDATFKTFCTWFKLKEAESGQIFFVFNTHLHYGKEETRKQSVLMLKERIPAIAGNYPVVLTGDMNDNAASYAITTLSSFMQDSYYEASKREGPAGTFSNLDPNYGFDRYRMDYVFFSDHFKINSYKVIDDTVDGYIPSDHFPVMCEVVLETGND